MAFNVLHVSADSIPTNRADETVRVQVTQILSNTGSTTNRVEARVFVDNDRYQGPSKTALVFDSADDVDDLIEALQDAVNVLRNTKVTQPTRRQVTGQRQSSTAAKVTTKATTKKPAPTTKAPARRRKAAPVAAYRR